MVPGALVVPGSSARLGDVHAISQNGEQTRLQPGAGFSVEVRGGTWRPVGNEVRFSADPNEIPEGGYAVTVADAGGLSLTRRFRPDFARVRGPEPGTLQAFDVSLVWQEDGQDFEVPKGTPLMPGQAYRVKIVAVDALGRQFSPSDSDYPIPLERIQLLTTGLERSSTDPLHFFCCLPGHFRCWRLSTPGQIRGRTPHRPHTELRL